MVKFYYFEVPPVEKMENGDNRSEKGRPPSINHPEGQESASHQEPLPLKVRSNGVLIARNVYSKRSWWFPNNTSFAEHTGRIICWCDKPKNPFKYFHQIVNLGIWWFQIVQIGKKFGADGIARCKAHLFPKGIITVIVRSLFWSKSVESLAVSC